MNATFKVDKRNEAIEEIAETLNKCEFLIIFEIQDRINKLVLCIQTEELEIEYTEVDRKRMETFLKQLKDKVYNKSDIDELIEELSYM